MNKKAQTQSTLTVQKTSSNTSKQYDVPTMRKLMHDAEPHYRKICRNSEDWDPTSYHPLEKRTHEYLTSLKIASIQRVLDAKGQAARFNKNGGAKNYLSNNMSIVHVEETGEECYADTQHVACHTLWSFEKAMLEAGWSQDQIDQHEHTVEVIRVPDETSLMDVFEVKNSSGIKTLSDEQTILARYFRGIPQEIALVRVLQATGRKFACFMEWQPAPFGQARGLADNRKTVNKGKFLMACKMDPVWCELVEAVRRNPDAIIYHVAIVEKMAVYKWLMEVIDVVPAFLKEEKDSVQLLEGAVTLLLDPNVAVLHNKPEPWNEFVKWFVDTIDLDSRQYAHDIAGPKGKAGADGKRYLTNQEAFCFTGLRASQKDGGSIAFQLIWNFINCDTYKTKWPTGYKGLGKTAIDGVRRKVSADYFSHEFSKSVVIASDYEI